MAESALAVFRVSGTDSIRLVSTVFDASGFASVPGNCARFGRLVASDGSVIDEAVAVAYRAPKSYTGEESAELTVHGGLAVIAKVMSLLSNTGFRQASPGEFTFRAFMNGKVDLVKAEAVQEIAGARTEIARRDAADRLSGRLSGEISDVKEKMVALLAGIELSLDYAEDDDVHDDGMDANVAEECRSRLELLAGSYSSGKLFRDGYSVAIAGRTNAGKSSLFNFLLREDRAIVSDVHGTTRDWLEAWIDIRGLPVRILDTAGFRQTEDAIERMGIDRSVAVSEEADAVLYVVDSTAGLTEDDTIVLGRIGADRSILVWNKVDKDGSLPLPPGGVAFSARDGTGFRGLEDAVLGRAFRSAGGARAESGNAIVASARQFKLVSEAAAALGEFVSACSSGIQADAAVLDLRRAVNALGELTGEITTDDILETMFSSFCVGK